VVITYGSTTGVEAGYADRPVIVMGPSAYDELGCATRVRTVAELREALERRTPPAPRSALPYGLMMKRRGFTYRYVKRSYDGKRILAGFSIVEPREIVRHISHRLRKWEMSFLTAEKAENRRSRKIIRNPR